MMIIEHLSKAFAALLGNGKQGDVAFTRAVPRDRMLALCGSNAFAIEGWRHYGVTYEAAAEGRLITGDRAVELRDQKEQPVLFLIDTSYPGAGLDGIYSASRELNEEEVVAAACEVARASVPLVIREFADAAVRKKTPRGARHLLAPWRVFEFWSTVAEDPSQVGLAITLLGFWPVKVEGDPDPSNLQIASDIAERVLPSKGDNDSVLERVDKLYLTNERQRDQLRRLLQMNAGAAAGEALQSIASPENSDLWINSLDLPVGGLVSTIQITPWIRITGSRLGEPLQWSGLTPSQGDGLPEYRITPAGGDASSRRPLEVRWTVNPPGVLLAGTEYRVAIVQSEGAFAEADAIVETVVTHAGNGAQKCRFQQTRFDDLPDGTRLIAKIRISVDRAHPPVTAESDEFLLLHADDTTPAPSPTGERVRCLAEGVIACETREDAILAAQDTSKRQVSADGTLVFKPVAGKTFYRVPLPPLLKHAEQVLSEQVLSPNGTQIGRLRAWMRIDGEWDQRKPLEFVPLSCRDDASAEKLKKKAKGFFSDAQRFGGTVGRISCDEDSAASTFLKGWADAVAAEHELALVNTVEVRDANDNVAGLLVLPSHPVRIAWQMGYDQLCLYCRYDADMLSRKRITSILRQLDSDSFPACLPGCTQGDAFIFGGLLGLSVVAMVPAGDPEPRSTVALLACCLGGETQEDDTAAEASIAISREILTYLRCHDTPRVLRVNAERPGDGAMLVSALGKVMSEILREDREDANRQETAFEYDLQLFPGHKGTVDTVGRFLTACIERRRANTEYPESARWMFDSYTTEANIRRPRLRWSRRPAIPIDRTAHVSISFDTFSSASRIIAAPSAEPVQGYGLISVTRRHSSVNTKEPWWESGPALHSSKVGIFHPANKALTTRLLDVHNAAINATARFLGGDQASWPVLRTELNPEDKGRVESLHRFSDWVITLDRQAAVEYFDSPSNEDTYEKYIIDCRPEREDLGALQLITSTSNLDEVRTLLDNTLGRLGLSSSRRNCEFLLRHLKAISGRLAIRVVSPGPARSELVALAMVQSHCAHAEASDPVWLSAKSGLFIPLDDIRDLCPDDEMQPLPAGESEQRADLLYVSRAPGRAGGLWFRCVEVKYRADKSSATSAQLLDTIPTQTDRSARRWRDYFFPNASKPEQILRRSRLVRVLRFYADKARRHYLSIEAYETLQKEFDHLLNEEQVVLPELPPEPHRGYIFCPQVVAEQPIRLDLEDGDATGVFLFGTASFPDRPVLWNGAARHEALPIPVNPVEQSSTTGQVINNAMQSIGSSIDSGATNDKGRLESSSPSATISTEDVRVLLGSSLVDANREVSWCVSIRGNPHLMMVGLPGMGKTTCLINICTQLRSQRVVPVVFSYHEDIDGKLAERFGEGNVKFLSYDDLRFNPMRIEASRTAHLVAASDIRDIFGAIFPDLGDLQLEAIRSAAKASYEAFGWGLNQPNTGLGYPTLSHLFDYLKANPIRDRGYQALIARLGEFFDFQAFIGEGEDPILESTKAIVLKIHSAPGQMMQQAFATMVFYKLYKDMFRRGEQNQLTHALVFDEAHRAAKLKLLPTMARECRKYGLTLVLASQAVCDFDSSLFSAVANYLVLRVNERDAKAVARNFATHEDRNRVVDRLLRMPRYRALFITEDENAKPVVIQLRE